jgi:hypothetical protein
MTSPGETLFGNVPRFVSARKQGLELAPMVGAAFEGNTPMKLSVTLVAVASSLAIAGFADAALAAQSHKVMPLVFQAPKSFAHTPSTGPIVGTWQVVYDGGFHNAFAQWQKGGTITQVPDFPPKTGNNLIVGDWKNNGDGSYSAFMAAWIWDAKGNNLIQHFTKKETVTPSGDAYSGTFEVTYYDLNGNVVFDHSGTLSATRLAP